MMSKVQKLWKRNIPNQLIDYEFGTKKEKR